MGYYWLCFKGGCWSFFETVWSLQILWVYPTTDTLCFGWLEHHIPNRNKIIRAIPDDLKTISKIIPKTVSRTISKTISKSYQKSYQNRKNLEKTQVFPISTFSTFKFLRTSPSSQTYLEFAPSARWVWLLGVVMGGLEFERGLLLLGFGKVGRPPRFPPLQNYCNFKQLGLKDFKVMGVTSNSSL